MRQLDQIFNLFHPSSLIPSLWQHSAQGKHLKDLRLGSLKAGWFIQLGMELGLYSSRPRLETAIF
jgi:hypothetical protein